MPAQSTFSVSFNGASEYISIGDVLNPGTGAFTMSFWIKTSTGTNQGIFTKALTGGSFQGFGINVNGGAGTGLAFVFGVSATTQVDSLASSTRIDDGAWHNVVGGRNGSTYFLYVDGVSQGTVVDHAYNVTTTVPLYVAAEGSTPGAFLTGLVDDVAYWLSDQSSHAAGIAAGSTDVSTLSPDGLWRLEAGSGTNAADTSGGGHNGTLTNGPTWSSDVPVPLQGGRGRTGHAGVARSAVRSVWGASDESVTRTVKGIPCRAGSPF